CKFGMHFLKKLCKFNATTHNGIILSGLNYLINLKYISVGQTLIYTIFHWDTYRDIHIQYISINRSNHNTDNSTVSHNIVWPIIGYVQSIMLGHLRLGEPKGGKENNGIFPLASSFRTQYSIVYCSQSFFLY